MNTSIKQQFVVLRAKGHSYVEIGAELKVSKQTLVNWSRELQVEVNNARAIEWDDLVKRLHLHADAKLEMFAAMLDRLKAEFLSRDLSSVPTSRLVDQIVKISGILAESQNGPMFWLRRNEDFMERVKNSCVVDDRWPV